MRPKRRLKFRSAGGQWPIPRGTACTTALPAELFPPGTIPGTPPLVPVALPSDLLERQPDVLRPEAKLHSATAQVGVATTDLFPKFSLTGSGGLQNLTQGSLANLAGSFWSLGPSVTLPIFNAGKIRHVRLAFQPALGISTFFMLTRCL